MPLTFEQRYNEIVFEVNKRESKWDLNNVEWQDARQLILIHIHKKYHLFDENKIVNGQKVEFSHWIQRVITRVIYGIWRDQLAIYSRPCLGNTKYGMERCAFNAGGDSCSATKSGKQCSECKLYKDWENGKKRQHDIKQPLRLENHAQEVSNIQSDFLDIGAAKKVIDKRMKERLTKGEYKIYRMLMIEGRPEKDVAKTMGKKKRRSAKMYANYQALLKFRHKLVDMAKVIISEENLA